MIETLGQWQAEPWQGQLHPGDVGWHSTIGAQRTAESLRLWTRHGEPLAVGMLDGPALLRMAFHPAARDDADLAAQVVLDLGDPTRGVLPAGSVVVEARGAIALDRALRGDGWVGDEPWTPLSMELHAGLDTGRLDACHLQVRPAGLEDVDDWIAVHWSAFKGTPMDEESRAGFRDRWLTMMTGPFAPMARSLIGYDAHGNPVAVTTVWSLGAGLPGLVEPMGVHQDHRGCGYGTAITLAGAVALQEDGASSAVLAAENANTGAMATYRAAGFVAGPPVGDLAKSN